MNIRQIEQALGMGITAAASLLGIDACQGSNPAFEFEDEWIGYAFFREQGFALSFCDGAFYRDDETNLGDEKILTTVLFYNDEDRYHHKNYPGDLPQGVAFSYDHAAMMAKFGPPRWQFIEQGDKEIFSNRTSGLSSKSSP
jgi:hypothetical protein